MGKEREGAGRVLEEERKGGERGVRTYFGGRKWKGREG